ncbi:MAG: MBOAT family protein, partial [Clostridiales bacterium]|nr:MBOAT family protein [Clostridiales bacterium]
IYTMILVMIGWSLFSWQDMADAAGYIKTMFFRAGTGFVNQQALYFLFSNMGLLLIAMIGSWSWIQRMTKKYILPERTMRKEVVETLFIVLLFFACVAMLVNSSYNPFLYFRF